MDEDTLNMGIRRFLKEVGVTSQRAIELAVRKAVDEGRLTGNEELRAQAIITLEGIDLSHKVTSSIKLA